MAKRNGKTAGGERDLLARALAMIAASGWRGFSLNALAAAEDLTLAEVYRQFGDKAAVLRALSRKLDEAMLALPPAELAALGMRERIFELVMRRLDAATPHKPALIVLAKEGGRDPAAILAGIEGLGRAAARIAQAAGISGVARVFGQKAIGLVLARVGLVWLADDSEDQAKTLAVLDQGLARIERLAQTAGRWCRPARTASAAG